MQIMDKDFYIFPNRLCLYILVLRMCPLLGPQLVIRLLRKINMDVFVIRESDTVKSPNPTQKPPTSSRKLNKFRNSLVVSVTVTWC